MRSSTGLTLVLIICGLATLTIAGRRCMKYRTPASFLQKIPQSWKIGFIVTILTTVLTLIYVFCIKSEHCNERRESQKVKNEIDGFRADSSSHSASEAGCDGSEKPKRKKVVSICESVTGDEASDMSVQAVRKETLLNGEESKVRDSLTNEKGNEESPVDMNQSGADDISDLKHISDYLNKLRFGRIFSSKSSGQISALPKSLSQMDEEQLKHLVRNQSSDSLASHEDYLVLRSDYFLPLSSRSSSVSGSAKSLLYDNEYEAAFLRRLSDSGADESTIIKEYLLSKQANALATDINNDLFQTGRETISELEIRGTVFTETPAIKAYNKAVQKLKEIGLRFCSLILGIDFTASNLRKGVNTYGGKPLHYLKPEGYNPYEQVIEIICKVFKPFNGDDLVIAFGFGDFVAEEENFFNINPYSAFCCGCDGVLRNYNETASKVEMKGTADFKPLIKEGIRIVNLTKSYHVLIIICASDVPDVEQFTNTVIDASNYPLFLLIIGVGDGPWPNFDSVVLHLRHREPENFYFVTFFDMSGSSEQFRSLFPAAATERILKHYQELKAFGMMSLF